MQPSPPLVGMSHRTEGSGDTACEAIVPATAALGTTAPVLPAPPFEAGGTRTRDGHASILPTAAPAGGGSRTEPRMCSTQSLSYSEQPGADFGRVTFPANEDLSTSVR